MRDYTEGSNKMHWSTQLTHNVLFLPGEARASLFRLRAPLLLAKRVRSSCVVTPVVARSFASREFSAHSVTAKKLGLTSGEHD